MPHQARIPTGMKIESGLNMVCLLWMVGILALNMNGTVTILFYWQLTIAAEDLN
jgi:hypothetical protein